MTPQAILLTGGGGVGKTTIAQALAKHLTTAGHPTAVLDLDAVAQFGPRPVSGSVLSFHDTLRALNLAAVWQVYAAAGAQFFVVSGPVTTAAHRTAYTEALPGCEVTVVRLVTQPELVVARTDSTQRGPMWNVQAALDDAESHHAVEDFTVSNDGTPEDAVAAILGGLGNR
ncbi:AAA family ATPase [Kribbella sp. NPDC026611]|uniref:nucleotide-binding protein n=1 Tax=Kribbella sp. NPDC026611 TaxID=3154911 RepID=UPI0033BFDF7C